MKWNWAITDHVSAAGWLPTLPTNNSLANGSPLWGGGCWVTTKLRCLTSGQSDKHVSQIPVFSISVIVGLQQWERSRTGGEKNTGTKASVGILPVVAEDRQSLAY